MNILKDINEPYAFIQYKIFDNVIEIEDFVDAIELKYKDFETDDEILISELCINNIKELNRADYSISVKCKDGYVEKITRIGNYKVRIVK